MLKRKWIIGYVIFILANIKSRINIIWINFKPNNENNCKRFLSLKLRIRNLLNDSQTLYWIFQFYGYVLENGGYYPDLINMLVWKFCFYFKLVKKINRNYKKLFSSKF